MLKGRCPQHWLIWFHGLLRQNRRAKQAHVPLERTPPHPPAMLPGLLPTEQAASSLLQMLRQISLKRWRVTSLKKNIFKDAKSSCEKSQRCHTVKLPSSLCFWRCDDLMLQSNFKRQAFYYCLPNFFIAHLRKKNLKSIHKHLQEKKSVNKAIFSTCV